jgi:hypothetical protein
MARDTQLMMVPKNPPGDSKGRGNKLRHWTRIPVAAGKFALNTKRMSLFGTNRTNRAGLTMSVDRGRAEVVFRGNQDRF